jgi:hypothetical protein
MTRKRLLLLAIIGLTLIGLAVGYFVLSQKQESDKTNDSTVRNASGIRGSVLLGPRCPGPQDNRNAACDDTPYQAKLVVATDDQAQVIKEFDSDDQGKFTVEVEPGKYAIRSASAADVLPYCSSGTITVAADEFTEITIHCETGLR